MNRREFSAGAACLLGATALGLPGLAFAQARPQEGQHFRRLDKGVAVEAGPGKIEVVEFFWYGCIHCNAFEPRLVAWSQNLPADVVLRRVPVAFRDDFVPHQRLFYTLDAMGKVGDLHHKVFEEIHGQRNPLNREELILAFAEKNGLDRTKFQELYRSFAVSSKARRAVQLQDAYGVEGVPSMGIAGRFYTDGTMAGNMERTLQVTDSLIAEVRRAK